MYGAEAEGSRVLRHGNGEERKREEWKKGGMEDKGQSRQGRNISAEAYLPFIDFNNSAFVESGSSEIVW